MFSSFVLQIAKKDGTMYFELNYFGIFSFVFYGLGFYAIFPNLKTM
jgi:hypothetical protein